MKSWFATLVEVFNVVKNSEKALTQKDLWFHDPDVNSEDENLLISRRGIDNGAIVNASTSEPIYQFSQKDMKNRQVIFRHSGALYAGEQFSVLIVCFIIHIYLLTWSDDGP